MNDFEIVEEKIRNAILAFDILNMDIMSKELIEALEALDRIKVQLESTENRLTIANMMLEQFN